MYYWKYINLIKAELREIEIDIDESMTMMALQSLSKQDTVHMQMKKLEQIGLLPPSDSLYLTSFKSKYRSANKRGDTFGLC